MLFTDGPGNSIQLSPNVTTLEVEAGTELPIINCTADCNPPCTYYWDLMGFGTGTGPQFNMGTANRYHNGKYTCKAENRVDYQTKEASISFSLYVRCEYTKSINKQLKA